MAVRKRGSYWWYDFRCNIHKTRHRASLREARTKAQAEQAEANNRLLVFRRGLRQRTKADAETQRVR